MSEYYRLVRSQIMPLLPPMPMRILDVGCGVGATTGWLKSRYPGSHTIGLEGNCALLPELIRNVDEAHIVDLNGALPTIEKVDLVLFLDILEHLVKPEAVLDHIISSMEEHGTVIISLPNVAHMSIAARLFFCGTFDYEEAGILDRTHLRFYYKGSAMELTRSVGLELERGLVSGIHGPKSRVIDWLTLGLVRDRLARQYIFSAKKRGVVRGPMLRWELAR